MESSSPPETPSISEAMMSSFEKLQSQLPAGTLKMSFTTPDSRQVLALKAQLDNAGAQAVVPPTLRPATAFHGFKKLPSEIQDMIWKLSFRQPRIFRVCDLAENQGAQPVVVSHKPLSSGQACRRSRLLYRRETRCAFGIRGGIRKSLRVSSYYDIFYWDMDARHGLPFGSTYGFENVALNLPQNFQSIKEVFAETDLHSYPYFEIKNLIFVVKNKSLPKTDVTFFDMGDIYGETMYFNNVDYTWKVLKKKTKEMLQSWSGLSNSVDIRAVEVAPIKPQDY
ncbi:unnamed protein product [Fusarium equiseti]|uniref:2EXR domain-containing protein n=1 Tax=Fusarium equiseti TaxID=61235 RepID=A0A8J2N818_FUSEQ|nr:unnamed protein product [Fusarium equiseti]